MPRGRIIYRLYAAVIPWCATRESFSGQTLHPTNRGWQRGRFFPSFRACIFPGDFVLFVSSVCGWRLAASGLLASAAPFAVPRTRPATISWSLARGAVAHASAGMEHGEATVSMPRFQEIDEGAGAGSTGQTPPGGAKPLPTGETCAERFLPPPRGGATFTRSVST